MTPMREKAKVMDADAMRRALARMAHEVLERNRSVQTLAVVGIQTRGVPLARRLADAMGAIEGAAVPVAALDVTPHRDDRALHHSLRSDAGQAAGEAHPALPFDVSTHTLILVDDVLFTGRTVRAALDALTEVGRPARIQLAVLIDRGHRELPVRPDYVGKNLPTSSREHVAVRLMETDGVDEVVIEEPTDGNGEPR